MSETVQIKTPWLASKDPEVPSTLNVLHPVHVRPGRGDGTSVPQLHCL